MPSAHLNAGAGVCLSGIRSSNDDFRFDERAFGRRLISAKLALKQCLHAGSREHLCSLKRISTASGLMKWSCSERAFVSLCTDQLHSSRRVAVVTSKVHQQRQRFQRSQIRISTKLSLPKPAFDHPWISLLKQVPKRLCTPNMTMITSTSPSPRAFALGIRRQWNLSHSSFAY